ncbi:MAG: PDZ domain-containing protein, partial [Bacteroidetes bacterium]
MKKYLPLLLVSFLSATLAIALYRWVEEPKIIIREYPATPRYTNFEEEPDLFSGTFQRQFISSAPTDFIAAAELVTPAVVNIKALEKSNFEWWSGSGGGPGTSSGSGVIISPDGYIVTNNHVIEEGDRFSVTLNDHREYEAKLIGTDPATDIAMLKIEEENLPFLIFGNSDSLRVGEWVLAVGNPFNLESTVTAGIVSAKGRDIQILEDDYSIESFIQTDAAVNPGNSGGALVNTNGELVGINTAIITRSGRYEGYSFAVPANLVQKVIRDLRDFGEVQRGLLGVRIGPVTSQRAKQLNLPAVEGVYISRVTEGGGADEAGLQADDVIVGINNIKITSIPELQEQVGRFRPGNEIQIEYIRDGERHRTVAVLKDRNNSTQTKYNVSRKESAENIPNDLLEGLGFELRNLTSDEARRLRAKGVYVEDIKRGSIIEETQMDVGFIITKINDKEVRTVEEVVEILRKSRGTKVYLEGFYENYRGEYY